MAKVTLPTGRNFHAFNNHLGKIGESFSFNEATDEYEVDTVTQAVLDAAVITYTADLANINAAWTQLLIDMETQRVKDTFDDDERRLLRAFAELLIDEFNTLRVFHGLAPRTFAQFRNAIKNKIT